MRNFDNYTKAYLKNSEANQNWLSRWQSAEISLIKTHNPEITEN